MRGTVKQQEEKWKKKKEEMRNCIKGLEKKVEELEGTGGGGLKGTDLKEGKGGRTGIVEDRLIEIERKIEIRKREERKRNIKIKSVKVKNGRRREAVKRLLNMIKADIRDKSRYGEGNS